MSTQAAKRYARAVFDLAREEGILEQVRQELQDLCRLCAASEDLVSFFEHPLIPVGHRHEAMETLFKGRVTDLVYRFLLLLEDKNRLGIFHGICGQFEELYREEKESLQVTVRSAVPLDQEQVEKLTGKLHKRYKRDIELEQEVLPDLVGGLRIQVGDTILDSSISHQLETFKLKLIRA